MEKLDNDVYKTRFLSEAISKMEPGTFCVMDCYYHQFSEGITGITRHFNYYVPEGGFKKRPAQQFKNNCLDKEKHIRGKGSWGIGATSYGKKVISYEELQKAQSGSYSYWDMSAYYGW